MGYIIEKYNREQLLHKILGYRSYLLSVIQFNKKYHCTLDETIDKYINIINDLEKISNDYHKKIDKLEKLIEENKYEKKISKVLISNLLFSNLQKELLSKKGYTTLNDLKQLTKKDLIQLKTIGTARANIMMKTIKNELKF